MVWKSESSILSHLCNAEVASSNLVRSSKFFENNARLVELVDTRESLYVSPALIRNNHAKNRMNSAKQSKL